MKTNIKDAEIISACETSRSMAEACSKVNLHWNTFRKKAIELGVFNPNQSGKGFLFATSGGVLNSFIPIRYTIGIRSTFKFQNELIMIQV